MSAGGSELFISDLHLSPHVAGISSLFVDFLAGPARQSRRLVILGDLFDYWAGDDDLVDPFNTAIVVALHDLARHGVQVDFMAGNRDFLIGEAFAAAAGCTLLADPCVSDIGGQRILLSHGDAYCTDDREYQQFRARVRSSEWRNTFLARPLAERKHDIEALRARSEAEKRSKPLAIMDVNPAAIAAALDTHHCAAMIHGHTHRQGRHSHASSIRWVLGDWHPDRGNALRHNSAGWNWLQLA